MGSLSVLIGFLLLIANPAQAWNAIGHRATAAIAFDQLSAEQQGELKNILREHPRYHEDFVGLMPEAIRNGSDHVKTIWSLEQAAIWPDLIRNLTPDVQENFSRYTWHYINRVVWLSPRDGESLGATLHHNQSLDYSPPLQPSMNIMQALPGNLEVWREESSSLAEKAVALCWILHLVGDLHQPLHTVALFSETYFPLGDRGGNSIKVRRGNQVLPLHAVWDGLPSNNSDFLSPIPRTLRLIKEDIVTDDLILTWLEQHVRLAHQFVYTSDVREQLLTHISDGGTPVIELTAEYQRDARRIARHQIQLAGHRIAKLLQRY